MYGIKIIAMKLNKSLHFLKPQLLNVLLTVIVLFLPILSEQYNNGQYVTWHRPIVVMIDNLRELKQLEILLIMFLFLSLVYFVVSLVIIIALKFVHPVLKNLRAKIF